MFVVNFVTYKECTDGLFFSNWSRNRSQVYCSHSQFLLLPQTALQPEKFFTLFSLCGMFLGLLLLLPDLLILLSDCRNSPFTEGISHLPVCDLWRFLALVIGPHKMILTMSCIQPGRRLGLMQQVLSHGKPASTGLI